ncbi:hypothetical protein PLESTF_000850800 [Pleodorina starrii]|nr:hypothetical protein PLESTF_000850800 [Pleodorina starrii]
MSSVTDVFKLAATENFFRELDGHLLYLRELRVHGVPLTPPLAARIASAAPALTKLILSGDCTGRESLQGGLPVLLRATPALTELSLYNVTAADAWPPAVGSSSGGGGSPRRRDSAVEHGGWLAALQQLPALRSLELYMSYGWQMDDAAAAALGSGLGSLSQLKRLVWEIPSDTSMAAALPGLVSGLCNLTSLSLHWYQLPVNVLELLSSLPQLETLSLGIIGGWSCGTVDLSYLARLTTLKSLSLNLQLLPDSITAGAAAAAGSRDSDGSFHLPPLLQKLRINKPIPLQFMAAVILSLSQQLRTVRLSLDGLYLPRSPAKALRQLEVAAPKLAAMGVRELAFQASPSSSSSFFTIDSSYWVKWLRVLAPLQLHTLKLRRVRLLGETPLRALRLRAPQQQQPQEPPPPPEPSISELVLEECELSPDDLSILWSLHRLRTLTIVGLKAQPSAGGHGGGDNWWRQQELKRSTELLLRKVLGRGVDVRLRGCDDTVMSAAAAVAWEIRRRPPPPPPPMAAAQQQLPETGEHRWGRLL